MYNKFFGFKEKPFKLVPNPEYLFLSKSHEEALAHLNYAISQGDGFVEITGEVGTGKTTLCRVFLENLDESIEAAYIFNPKLDALQLLKVINDEFGIDSTPDNTKDLIDRLNTFLIEKKGAGHKVLVLIDEAQNLSLEVLEQLRLLSNLETTQEKLLQIILVGQPELGDLLSSHQLRQLGQRITINCQLDPMTFQETKDYIRHRIALASHRAGPPFDSKAYRAIYEYSRGVPRLINIACDRILLNAFSRNTFKITGPLSKEAIQELRHRTKKGPSRPHKATALIAIVATAICLVAVLLYLYTNSQWFNSADIAKPPASNSQARVADARQNVSRSTPVIASAPGSSGEFQESTGEKKAPDALHTETTPLDQISPAAAPMASDAAAERFLYFLKNLRARPSRNNAMLETLKLWSSAADISQPVSMIETDEAFFRGAAGENDLHIQSLATDTDINLIQTLNLPAILTFYLPNHAWPRYLTLTGIDTEKAYLIAGDQGGVIAVDRRTLQQFWSGEAHIVWKNFLGLEGPIKKQSRAESVQTLKVLLHDLAYLDDINSAGYDAYTIQIVKDIQAKNGLNADGIVGPLTKIALYNENNAFATPSLSQFMQDKLEAAK